MNQGKLLSIFRTIQSAPTAPFHEYFVARAIQDQLAGCPQVTLTQDPFGNLLASYQAGEPGRLVFAAHMDHPGFVRHPATGDWRFLGGINEEVLQQDHPRKEFGDFAMWDLLEWEIEDGQVIARVCDDLAGCAALVALLLDAAGKNIATSFDVVFTRGEEVGFWGAIQLARNWPWDTGKVFVSLETSSPVAGVVMGGGPVIRAGDAVSVFDPQETRNLEFAAQRAGVRYQKALLNRGSCEATAVQHYGIRSAGISILLGNYHNCGLGPCLQPEFVMVSDLEELHCLLMAVIQPGSEDAARLAMEAKFERRIQDHLIYAQAGERHFVA